MKKQLSQSIEIPEGINCHFANQTLTCKKDSLELSRKISSDNLEIKIKDSKILIECKKGNKNDHKNIMTTLAHIKNIFRGLTEEFTYTLEIANIHFPMTAKIDGDKIFINNFLGEKTPRQAKILPDVKVEIKGHQIKVSSHNRESAGQTAANLEQATKIGNRDRRIFQDGIFITEKPRRHEQ